MKNLTKILLVSVLVLGLSAGAWIVLSQKTGTNSGPVEKAIAGRQSLDACLPFPTGTSTPRTDADGTTRYVEENNAFWIEANATSTFECSINGADLVDINLFFVPSSSAAYPTMDLEFSRANQSPNSQLSQNEWFSSVTKLVNADGKVELSTTTYAFEHGVEGTTTINLTIDPLSAPLMKVNLGAGGGAGSMYVEVIKRNQL